MAVATTPRTTRVRAQKPRSTAVLFLALFSFRLLNALLVRTHFQPDEFYQSQEVAHHLVFGYGFKTWEWRESRIRSPLHPLLLVPIYWLLKVTGLDATSALTHAPKIVPAILATCIDYGTYRFASKTAGENIGFAALVCSLISFPNAFISVRNFSNTLETALTAAVLALWPFHGFTTRSFLDSHVAIWKALLAPLSVAALAVIVRPTSVVLWLHLGIRALHKCSWFQVDEVFILVFFVSCGALATCFTLDSYFYSQITLTPFNFLTQNVFNSISLFYGTMPWHYYLSQALPLLSWIQLPWVFMGARMVQPPNTGLKFIMKNLSSAVTRTVVFFSLLAHKEVRFIQPLLPILHFFAALGHLSTATPTEVGAIQSQPTVSARRTQRRRREKQSWGRSVTRSKIPMHRVAILALAAWVPALYLNTLHSSAQVSVLEYLRSLPSSDLQSVAFLMPCHSTPWQSHLHRQDLEEPELDGSGRAGRLWFLTCEPPIAGQDAEHYQDQSDFFYNDPAAYLQQRFPSEVNRDFLPSPLPCHQQGTQSRDSFDLGWQHEWPSHIVLFDALLKIESVQHILAEKGYQETWRKWNSHFQDDARRNGDVVVLQWHQSAPGHPL